MPPLFTTLRGQRFKSLDSLARTYSLTGRWEVVPGHEDSDSAYVPIRILVPLIWYKKPTGKWKVAAVVMVPREALP